MQYRDSDMVSGSGKELELFRLAKNWKRYWGSQIQSAVNGDVLEVGAGLGANTAMLASQTHRRWVCLEPDFDLTMRLKQSISDLNNPNYEVRHGKLTDLPESEQFDAILYIDVLEHIQDDLLELARASNHLRSAGALIVLAPAHQWLFTPFDAAVGHFRRYSKRNLLACGPTDLRLEKIRYVDAVGLVASLGNRLLLRQQMPSHFQIQVWDGLMVPLSRVVDPLLRYRFGKSLIAVWRKM